MIHYHGTPLGGTRDEVSRFLRGRHAFIPYKRSEDIFIAADTCRSFAIDNSAFTAWKQGEQIDFDAFTRWVGDSWSQHPGFDWAVIPDVIEGREEDNDALIAKWPKSIRGVPVWHMHESLERFQRLCDIWPTVAIGSSGQWPNPGTDSWWDRMADAMDAICDKHGRPPCRLHGLRMLNPQIFGRLPFSSADSTNVAQNASIITRFGMYTPPTRWQRAEVIASRIEQFSSAPVWIRADAMQMELFA